MYGGGGSYEDGPEVSGDPTACSDCQDFTFAAADVDTPDWTDNNAR